MAKKVDLKKMFKGEESEPMKKMKAGGKCYRAGGFVKAADGVAIRGRTKGKFL